MDDIMLYQKVKHSPLQLNSTSFLVYYQHLRDWIPRAEEQQ